MPIHSDARRAEAIGLGLALGADEASARTGIPRRTISRWLADPRRVEEASDPSTHEAIVGKLWEAIEVGTTEVLAGLKDPKARLGDKAQALRVVSERHALLTGGATAHLAYADVGARDPDRAAENRLHDEIEAMTWEEKTILANAFDDAMARILAARAAGVTLDPFAELTRLRLGDGRNGS